MDKLKLMSGTMDPDNPFVEWLLDQLHQREWTREELARRADMRSSVINNIVSRSKNLGPDVARKIASALGVPQQTIFVIAQLMDDQDVEDAKEQDQIRRVSSLIGGIEDDDERQQALDIIEAVVQQITERKKRPKAARSARAARPDLARGKP